MATASDVAALFPGPEDWNASSCITHLARHSATDYLGLSVPHVLNSHPRYPFSSDTGHTTPTESERHHVHESMKAMQVTFDGLNQAVHMSQVSAPLHFAPPTLYTSKENFTASSAPTAHSPATNTISPLQTRFDSTSVSNASISTDNNMHSSASSSFDPWNDNVDEDSHSQKRSRRSATTHVDGASPTIPRRTMGRRRKSEDVEPGSARAVYLEKNRKAASKCRTKQKMQQEELVETARELERKNKALKAEVDFLKADMRDLMDMVGKHTGCPDKRLQTYVQHEADRLVAGDKDSMVGHLLSPKGSRASPTKG